MWVFGINTTSFLPFFFFFFFLLQGDKSNSDAAVWDLEVYMWGKFFFSGSGEIGVLKFFFFSAAPQGMRDLSFRNQGTNPCPCSEEQLCSHQTTGEVPGSWLLFVVLLPVEFYFHRWCALNIWNGLIRFMTNLKQGSLFLLPPLSYPNNKKNSAPANGWLPAYRFRLLLDYGKSLLHEEVKFCGQGDYAEIFSCVLLELRKSIELGWNILGGAGRTTVGLVRNGYSCSCPRKNSDNKLALDWEWDLSLNKENWERGHLGVLVLLWV